MKNKFILLTLMPFITSCGCGASAIIKDDHPTQIVSSPENDRPDSLQKKVVYNYYWNQAQLLNGDIDIDKFCKAESELFEANFTDILSCKNTWEYYDNSLNNSEYLKERAEKALNVVTPKPEIFEYTTTADYSELGFAVWSREWNNKTQVWVESGGIKIFENITFSKVITGNAQNMAAALKMVYLDELHKIEIIPDSPRIVITYNLPKNNVWYRVEKGDEDNYIIVEKSTIDPRNGES